MDPFDEFEFKPLTEGLGFHKKATPLKDQVKSSGLLDDKLKTLPTAAPRDLDAEELASSHRLTFDDVISSLERSPLGREREMTGKDFLEVSQPLPREAQPSSASALSAMEIEMPRPIQSPFPSSDTLKRPMNGLKKVPRKQELASVGTRRGAADSPQSNLVEASTSFAAAILDLIVITALSLIFVISLLTVTKVDLALVVANLKIDLMTQIAFGVLFVAIMQMYVIISRSYFGRTLGEWTFDVQLGKDDEQHRGGYPLKVTFRSFLVTVTGLVLLPVLSALFRTDLAGRLSGVRLYKQRV